MMNSYYIKISKDIRLWVQKLVIVNFHPCKGIFTLVHTMRDSPTLTTIYQTIQKASRNVVNRITKSFTEQADSICRFSFLEKTCNTLPGTQSSQRSVHHQSAVKQ